MNADLATVGAIYAVIKYSGSGTDRPHWSDTGISPYETGCA